MKYPYLTQKSSKMKAMAAVGLLSLLTVLPVHAQRQLEALDRGLVAVNTSGANVYVGWRVLGNDPSGIAFNLYRGTTKLNATPITGATNYTDAAGSLTATYTVRPVINGVEQAVGGSAKAFTGPALTIPLNRPAQGTTPTGEVYTYAPNDISVADVDADGQYEIILKWDPSNAKDNSQSGYTGNVFIDAYELDGTRLWRIDLGKNIRAGAHYTQLLAYDMDGDGYAEVACKTAPGTIDGKGVHLSKGPAASDNNAADHRNSSGYILAGPEYLTVFNGKTGAELATVNYNPVRGTVSSWGDSYGNRVDRFNSTVAWLDGKRPSMVFQRGYYTRLTAAAWDYRNGTLTQRWFFDSNVSGNTSYAGQGNHGIMAADVDGDGKDEILFGSSAIDDNGAPLWNNRLGHGDAHHIGDMVPSRPGLEMWSVKEHATNGVNSSILVDAKTGARIWGYNSDSDVGRGNAADIDASSPGYEMWSSATPGVYKADSTLLHASKPSVNFRIYWDGDLQDELLDGTKLDKWNGTGVTRLLTIYNSGGESNNGTKATPGIVADILGDWREEMIMRHNDNTKLLVYTTTISTTHRLYTLMHDPLYRAATTWQQSSYNQPPHLGFFLGAGVDKAPKPSMYTVGPLSIVSSSSAAPLSSSSVKPSSSSTVAPSSSSVVLPSSSSVVVPSSSSVAYVPNFASLIQAEDFCSAEGVLESKNLGFNGVGYLNLNNAVNTIASYAVTSPTAQTVSVSIRYAHGTVNDRPIAILVNGTEQIASQNFVTTTAWTTWNIISVNLSLVSGRNEIVIKSLTADGAPNIDLFGFSATGIVKTTCTVEQSSSSSVVENPEEDPLVPVIVNNNKVLNWIGVSQVKVYTIQGRFIKSSQLNYGESLSSLGLPKGPYLIKRTNPLGFSINLEHSQY